jgi:hypothetical protein
MVPILLGALLLAASQPQPEQATIHVEASRVLNHVSPWMTGSCIEDVNHEIYGGLYAQMIFGESFEEPPTPVSPLAGWQAFGGTWRVADGACGVDSEPGAKLVRESPAVEDGLVECDVRLDDDKGDNAGLILRVSDPRVGADAWIGYEVSISNRNHAVILGRHRNNWTLLRSAPADIAVGEWHRLRVRMDGPRLRIWLDAIGAAPPIIDFDDGAEALPGGRIGVRTWNSRAGFRRLRVRAGAADVLDEMDRPSAPTAGSHVSGMWTSFTTGNATGGFDWETGTAFNSLHSQRIEDTGGTGSIGIYNLGLNRWGLSVRAGHRYAGRLYLRQAAGSPGVVIALQSADGERTYARQRLAPCGDRWTRRNFTLAATDDDTKARFAVLLDAPGSADVDQVVLTPTGVDLFHGLPVRADIGKALQAEGLTFLRYGGSMVNAPGYRWKQMIGDPGRRPQYTGTWYSHSSNGFGIEEYVRFCRAAGIEPAFAVNIEETPQDAADLVEYLNGPEASTWGRRRALNGHPAPYHVRFIEIGNEETTNAHYIERFTLLEAAMHRADPSLQLVIAAWWEPDNPVSKRIVQDLNGKAALWDVHVGGDDLNEGTNVDALFTRMEHLVRAWSPGTGLKACVFEENGDRHDFQRALSSRP